MKFGKVIKRTADPEWDAQNLYVDYKLLKQLIKAIQAREDEHKADSLTNMEVDGVVPMEIDSEVKADSATEAKYAEFFAALETEAEKVDSFYTRKVAHVREALVPLVAEITESKDPTSLDRSFHQSLLLHVDMLDKLRGYSILNHLAFYKIMKKFDKRYNETRSQEVLESVQSRPFYCSHELAELLTQAQCAADVLADTTDEEKLEEYKCPVCFDVLRNPVVLSCAHRFCWSCLAKASLFGQACPICRKVQSLDPRDYEVDSTLQDFISRTFPGLVKPAELRKVAQPTPESSTSGTVSSPSYEFGVPGSRDDTQHSEPAPLKSTLQTASHAFKIPGSHQHEHPIPVNKINTLLKHKKPQALIVVDIDETLVMSPTYSALLSSRGIKVFQNRVNHLEAEYVVRTSLCQQLQQILDDKVLCEPETADVIRSLQEAGCWVLGLTARYSSMAMTTQVTLHRLGIDLNVNSPLPRDQALQDPDTAALFCNGVIFTNAGNKGDVLHRFLSNVILRDDSQPPLRPPPSEIVFIDDRYDNGEAVLRHTLVSKQRNIPLVCYHYTGAARKLNADADALIAKQIDVFFSAHKLLSDEDTRKLLNTQ